MGNNTFVTTENGTANYDWKAIAKANEESYANQLADSKKASQKQYLTEVTTKYANDTTERSTDFQSLIDFVRYAKYDYVKDLIPEVRELFSNEREKYEKLGLSAGTGSKIERSINRKIAKKYLTQIQKDTEEYREFVAKNTDVCRRELLKSPAPALDDLSYAEAEKMLKDFERRITISKNIAQISDFTKDYKKKFKNDAVAMQTLLDKIVQLSRELALKREDSVKLTSIVSKIEYDSLTQNQQLAAKFLDITKDVENHKLIDVLMPAGETFAQYLGEYRRYLVNIEKGLEKIREDDEKFRAEFGEILS